MSRSAPTDPVPTKTFQGRRHEYVANSDGELELVAISPGCVCKDCVALRVKQSRSSKR